MTLSNGTIALRQTLPGDAVSRIVESGIFDLEFYRAQTGKLVDLPRAIEDYVSRGEGEGLLPNALFLPAHVEPQLIAAGLEHAGSTLLAYLQAPGAAINPHPLFDCRYYRSVDSEIPEGETELENYMRRCRFGELLLSPNMLFDPEFYCARYGDVTHSGVDAFRHYVTIGRRRRYRPHPLFDPIFWEKALGGLGIAVPSLSPLEAYCQRTETWPAATHPLFDPAYYDRELDKRGLCRDPECPPLVDMLRRKEDVSSHYLFDPEYYLRQAEIEGVELGSKPLLHYVRGYGRTGLDPHPLFHTRFYLWKYPGLVAAQCGPLEHFLETGSGEGKDPNPLFSQKYYRATCPELRRGKEEALKHYVDRGARELRDPHPLFEAKLYAACHPDCLNGQDNPLCHYVRTWMERGVRFPPWGTLMIPRRGHGRDQGQVDMILVAHELSVTGAPRILLRIAEHLAKRRDFRLIVLAAKGGGLLDAFCEWASVLDLSSLPGGEVTPDDFLTLISTSFQGRKRPKLALVNTACVPQVGEALGATGIPLITLVHELASGFSYDVFKTIYDSSRFVVYPAAFVREEAHRLHPLPMAKSMVIPQGLLDPEFGRSESGQARQALLEEIGAPADAFVVLGCGSLDLRKGIDVFVKVAIAANKTIGGDHPRAPIYFVWVGEGVANPHSPFWYALQDVIRSGIEEYVHFVGGRADPEPYFQACDAFIVTSRLDPFPCVVHEAMACAKPVIAFDNAGGAPEALVDGAGVIVPYGDAVAMAEALRNLADDRPGAEEVGRRARVSIHKNYAFADYVEKILGSVEQRIGITMAGDDHSASKPARRGRVIFALPDWSASSTNSFIERLAQGLTGRGFQTEFIFTESKAAALDLARLPAVPYRFLMSSMRAQMGYGEKWKRLESSLHSAAPAIYIHNLDIVGSAVAPVLPKGIGVLGMLHDDHPDYYEQAARLGRYWQRIVVATPKIADRVGELFPELTARTIEIPHGVPDHGPPSQREAGAPLHIVCPSPPAGRNDMLHFLRSVIEGLNKSAVSCSFTLIRRSDDESLLASIFERELAAGTVRMVPGESAAETLRLLRASDVLILFDSQQLAVKPIEAMSLGVAIVVVSGRTKPEGADLVIDGRNGHVVPLGKPGKCNDVLVELANHVSLRHDMRQAAYETSRTHSTNIDSVCDRYAELLENMFGEIRSGKYLKPGPIFNHPAFGGLSLPPALQFNPDEVNGPIPATIDSHGVGALPKTRQAGGASLHQHWLPIFKLAREGAQPLARGRTSLQWLGEELEMATADGDAGILIDIDSNYSHRLILRMELRADRAGMARVLSQTITEPDFTDISRIQYAVAPGLNEIKLEITREASIRAVRIDPGDQAGLSYLRKLTILAPASAELVEDTASLLPVAKIVDFSADGNADEYLAGLWYAAESKQRWAHGGGGEVQFVPEFPEKEEARLWVLCRVVGTAVLGSVKVAVKLGDEAEAETWTFYDDGWKLKSVVLPRLLPAAKRVVRINFHREYVESPASLFGSSTDKRELGIGLRTMGIFPDSTKKPEIEAAFKLVPSVQAE